ncbi:hypothetical protein IW18_18820 [Flavobacterium hibernum]|uniref:Uncharacterized protein n=2 Tax=Flavobacterium hibernum TaxID=37752 RepID=A0A0D0ESG6_9FLAO|nr:hypothetical protein IW18_18820 [Flavobacterium hibernum]OXA85115.1 hypothetical protein B0A73_17310 [Flavobacterium hibernum]STO19484.1 Uncharacterised protein [Flavobacterium hibernum]
MKDFEIWMEFEAVEPSYWDIENEFCNIQVRMKDGRKYGINVWTYDFLKTAIEYDKKNGYKLDGLYQIPPDLFVKELTRDCIEKAIQDLLDIDNNLERVLNSSIVSQTDI